MLQKAIIILLLIFALIPAVSLANGGDQRIVEGGNYFINLSRAPFTPRAGEKIAMLISIASRETGRPVKDDLILRIRVAKLGGTDGKREFLFEQKEILVKGGIFEFSYTFADPGLHEIFFDFLFLNNQDKVYESPDFLLDIQKPEIPERNRLLFLIVIFSALIGGGMVGWVVGRRIT